MAQGFGQRELISKQRDLEGKSDLKLPVKEGSIIEFTDMPEFNGFVKRISKDQWQTVYIDYGVEGKSKIIHGHEIIELFSNGKIIVKNVSIKAGTRVEFVNTPEFNGIVKRTLKDKWQTVCVNYGVENEIKEIKGYQFIEMLENKLIVIKNKS